MRSADQRDAQRDEALPEKKSEDPKAALELTELKNLSEKFCERRRPMTLYADMGSEPSPTICGAVLLAVPAFDHGKSDIVMPSILFPSSYHLALPLLQIHLRHTPTSHPSFCCAFCARNPNVDVRFLFFMFPYFLFNARRTGMAIRKTWKKCTLLECESM